MTHSPDTSPTRRARRFGLGIAEAVVCVFIVGVAITSALTACGGAIVAQAKAADRARARLLADALLGEILALDYEDQTAAVKLFGPEAGELPTSKANYNDVDDFNGWSESPPKDRANFEITNFPGWRREVAVAWVTTTNPNQTSATETGAKRISVTVKRGNVTLATRVAIRAKS